MGPCGEQAAAASSASLLGTAGSRLRAAVGAETPQRGVWSTVRVLQSEVLCVTDRGRYGGATWHPLIHLARVSQHLSASQALETPPASPLWQGGSSSWSALRMPGCPPTLSGIGRAPHCRYVWWHQAWQMEWGAPSPAPLGSWWGEEGRAADRSLGLLGGCSQAGPGPGPLPADPGRGAGGRWRVQLQGQQPPDSQQPPGSQQPACPGGGSR